MNFSWKKDLPDELQNKITKVEKMIAPRLDEIDEQVLYNQQRVLNLFREKLILEIETQFFSKIGNILKRKPIEKK